jgi:hypothetical protein
MGRGWVAIGDGTAGVGPPPQTAQGPGGGLIKPWDNLRPRTPSGTSPGQVAYRLGAAESLVEDWVWKEKSVGFDPIPPLPPKPKKLKRKGEGLDRGQRLASTTCTKPR